ncbi:MAG: hypothetical protein HY815_22430 [Candidatus Riflebacteria bacterium]|nr:hypothetical protein [Candidatus Riflebacteria bacterium]
MYIIRKIIDTITALLWTAAAVLATSVAGAVVLAAGAITVTTEVGAAAMPKLVTVILTRLAMMTGIRLAAGISGKLAGAMVGLGVIVWDILDHQRTVAQQRPILKASIEQYLDQLKVELLHGPSGIAAVLDQFDRQLAPSLQPVTGRP